MAEPAIAGKLHAEVTKALAVRERLVAIGVDPMPMTLAEFGAFFKKDVADNLALDYAKASRMAIARADQAGDTALAEAAGCFQALGKAVSVTDDAPGLVIMRTVAMLANEAADVIHQGVASAVDVDVSMRNGVGYPRGPLEWADSVGPRRIAGVIDALGRAYGEDRYRNSPLLRRRALSDRLFRHST